MFSFMRSVKLANGLEIIYENKKNNSVVVQVMIKVGSNDENKNEMGISHFLEHILFEGTINRPTNQEISNEIEKIGGEFNAYTTNERTCFYIKVLKKHFLKAVEILSDILQNPLFDEKHITKEKNIVLKEIDMIHDEPSYYQWVLLQKNLFKRHPCKNPTYGDRKIIKSLTREKIKNFFEKHYLPNNMVISVVGDVKNWKKEIEKKFIFKGGKINKNKPIKEPSAKKNKIVKEKRKIVNTYLALGFKAIPRSHRDTYTLEVINGVLGRGQSGKMFNEIRSKRGLAYDVGTQNIGEVSFGYFAVYATINRKDLNSVKKIIIDEIKKLKNITNNELIEAKTFIEGNYLLSLEDPQKMADQLLYWNQIGKTKGLRDFISNIKKVTMSDVQRAISKYFSCYTMAVVEGK